MPLPLSQCGTFTICCGWTGANSKIDNTLDIPVIVDEDVALVQVGQCQYECITFQLLIPEDRKHGSQRHEGGKLEDTVRPAEYGIGLEAQSVFLISQHVMDERSSGGICQVLEVMESLVCHVQKQLTGRANPRYAGWDLMPVPEHSEIQERAIRQGYCPLSFESPRANSRKGDVCKVE